MAPVLPLRQPPEPASEPVVAAAGSARRRSGVARDALVARLRAESRSAPRQVSAWDSDLGSRPARPASLKVACHVRVAVAAYPEEGVAEAEAVPRSEEARPEVAASLRQAAVLHRVAEAAARSAAVDREARRSGAARPSVVEAAAGPPEEPVAGVAVVRPQVAAHAAGLRTAAQRAEAAGALGAAAVPLPEAAEWDVAVPRLAVAAELDAAVPLPAVVVRVGAEAAVRRRAAQGEVAARRAAVAWAFRLDRLPPWPGPRQAARSAHARQERSTASP